MTVSGHNEISPGIVLFDGLCHLCSGWVRFVFHRDKQARIRFAPLQSNIAKEFMEKLDVSANSLETIVYIEVRRKKWRDHTGGKSRGKRKLFYLHAAPGGTPS